MKEENKTKEKNVGKRQRKIRPKNNMYKKLRNVIIDSI